MSALGQGFIEVQEHVGDDGPGGKFGLMQTVGAGDRGEPHHGGGRGCGGIVAITIEIFAVKLDQVTQLSR